jgi:hypothetical protein
MTGRKAWPKQILEVRTYFIYWYTRDDITIVHQILPYIHSSCSCSFVVRVCLLLLFKLSLIFLRSKRVLHQSILA